MVQVFDSHAGMLGPGTFSKFALPYLRYISKKTNEMLADKGVASVPMVS